MKTVENRLGKNETAKCEKWGVIARKVPKVIVEWNPQRKPVQVSFYICPHEEKTEPIAQNAGTSKGNILSMQPKIFTGATYLRRYFHWGKSTTLQHNSVNAGWTNSTTRKSTHVASSHSHQMAHKLKKGESFSFVFFSVLKIFIQNSKRN